MDDKKSNDLGLFEVTGVKTPLPEVTNTPKSVTDNVVVFELARVTLDGALTRVLVSYTPERLELLQ